MEPKLKNVLFQLAKSHSHMSQLEYARNPSYNNLHPSHKAETDLVEYAQENGLFDELMEFMNSEQ